MDHNGGNFSSPWAAVLGHHHPMTPDPNFAHHGLPMDLHVSQGFPYYRWFVWIRNKLHIILTSQIAFTTRKCNNKCLKLQSSGQMVHRCEFTFIDFFISSSRFEWKQKRKNFAVWLCIDRLEKLSNDNVGH